MTTVASKYVNHLMDSTKTLKKNRFAPWQSFEALMHYWREVIREVGIRIRKYEEEVQVFENLFFPPRGLRQVIHVTFNWIGNSDIPLVVIIDLFSLRKSID